MSLGALLTGDRTRLIADGRGPSSDDEQDPAAIVLGGLSADEARDVRELAAHVREVLTGYRSGSEEIALAGEPRADFAAGVPMMSRYRVKAVELGLCERQVRRLVKRYGECGAAGLVPGRRRGDRRVDERWVATAMQVMVEHTDESKPSESAVIYLTAKRLELEYGVGVVKEPSRATAYRVLEELEQQWPTFKKPTKRNRDIAGRPKRPYRKLRATRPGEYLILDTTPLDVFAFDQVTLEWVRVELTIAMDWYTRCVVALRLSPWSTKAVDVGAVMFRTFQPLPAGEDWPDYAVWPAHGIPREVIIDPAQFDSTGKPAATPALNPEAIVIDHGKIYVSDHVTSVCQRMGISIEPVHVREGREKGPLERFFRTIREGLLQFLPGYKGPDINSRGLDVESHAFFYIDELEAIMRYWVATYYHHKRHESLRDPDRPKKEMTPAQMFTHGITRAGYIEAPRDPQLAYEFLKVEPRIIHPYGVRRMNLKYGGESASCAADSAPRQSTLPKSHFRARNLIVLLVGL
jgi:transposase InsO family protein